MEGNINCNCPSTLRHPMRAKWNRNKSRSFGIQLSPSFNSIYDIDIVIQMGAMQKTMRFQTPESTHWVIKNYAEGTNLFIRYLASVGPDNPFKESLVICMVIPTLGILEARNNIHCATNKWQIKFLQIYHSSRKSPSVSKVYKLLVLLILLVTLLILRPLGI